MITKTVPGPDSGRVLYIDMSRGHGPSADESMEAVRQAVASAGLTSQIELLAKLAIQAERELSGRKCSAK